LSRSVGKSNEFYDVKINRHPGKKAVEQLRSDVRIEEGVNGPCWSRNYSGTAELHWLRIALHQGWNRQIKRIGEAVEHSVLKIRRISYGPVHLGGLQPGRYRLCRPDEILKIYEEARIYRSDAGDEL